MSAPSAPRTAELCHAFGCKILGNKRHVRGNEPDYIEFVSLEELLSRSDIVSLHCPLNEDSRGMINKDTIAKMKPGALLINAARGPVVDSQALADALNSGYLGGAGIDVFETEPPLDPAHPLLHSKNTIVTPHVAFASAESMEARCKIVFDNIAQWMDGHQTTSFCKFPIADGSRFPGAVCFLCRGNGFPCLVMLY